jgi:predicted chitinase
MPVKFNANNVLSLYYADGGKTSFPSSLKKILTNYTQNDTNLNNVKELAYLLATAKAESDYSLQRWEADYMCGEKGVAYIGTPCNKALDYYRSSNGKLNYFKKGVDTLGVPYFGRGLIQLTHKDNYARYGGIIGVDLVADGDKALIPKNSYKIASAYLNRKTFGYVNKGDLTRARRSVNGGTKGIDKTNASYRRWLRVLGNPASMFESFFWTKRRRRIFGVIIATTFIIGGIIIYKGINK